MPRAMKVTILALMLTTTAGLRYVLQTADGSIQPNVVTWLLFCVAVSLSMWTYVSTERHNVVANLANLVDVVYCWIEIMVIVFISPHPKLSFNGFELACLASALLIGVLWRKTKQHVIANLALQAIMVVAYLPTIYGLWNATQNHESLSAWGIQWFAAVCMLMPPITKRDRLATVYAARSFTFITLMLFLMIRIEVR